jgi:olefin beta-lactone synthetase
MNIALRISSMSRQFPHKKSVILGKDHSFYSFEEFENRSNQMAHQFISLGLKPGMRTLLFVKPCLDFSVITFALFKMGAVPVLIDPGMGIKNLLRSIEQIKPEAMVSIGLVHWIRRFKRHPFRSIKVNISLNRVGGKTSFLYNNLDLCSKEYSPVEVSPSDTAAILFTSGGTGIPKGVIYSHGILNAQTESLQKMFGLDETKIDLPGFPLFALFTLAMGMSSVVAPLDPSRPGQCDPKKIVQTLLDYKITFAAGSPIIWERVAKYCLDHKVILPYLEQVVMFGAPVRYELHEKFQKILTIGDTYTPYGATECLPVSLIRGSEVLRQHLPKMLQGAGTCIGKAVDHVEIKIIKVSDIPETTIHEIPLGEKGEIIVRAPQVTPGYFGLAQETLNAKISQGDELWHRMGDMGYLDENGDLWFLGRKVHRVESEGETFYPMQIEAIFNQSPWIKRSALIGINIAGKLLPALAIERHDGSTKMTQDFLNHLNSLKVKTKTTDKINYFLLHPNFPVDVRHNIKIDRTALSQWAQKNHPLH